MALHEIRDPVHNFIIFDDFEKELINSKPVQRLKQIKQLAMTYEIYPGAAHSRFEHSLGTMELATQAFQMIVRKRPRVLGDLNWTDYHEANYRQLLRVGALLHDIGHAPFSHAPEELLPNGFDGHEAFSAEFIRSDYVRPFLTMGPVALDAEHVVAVALGPEKSPQEDPSLQLLQELVGGELGVDRMDYLVRDSLHTGATAGRFDYHRLLNTLTVIEHPVTGSPVLAIEAGGLHAAEGLLLARYFMFLQVYFHDVRRIYDVHLKDYLGSHLPAGRFPSELSEYVRLTDQDIHASVAKAIAETAGNADLASRLVDRQHYRLVCELKSQNRAQDPGIFQRLEQAVADQFGDAVRSDQAGKEAQTLEEGRLYIVQDNGDLRDILEESELIRSLKPIWKGRIYSDLSVRPDVNGWCRRFLEQEGQAL